MFRLTRMKLDRAKQRMKELEEALQSFYATNPFKFSGKADLQAGKVVYTMDSVKDAPDEASLIAGEIIQNLRSALDHLAYQLFLRAGGTGAGKNIYFPQIVFLVDQRSVFLAQCVQWFTPSYAVRLQPEQYPIKDRFAPVMVIACCPPRDQSRRASSSNTMK